MRYARRSALPATLALDHPTLGSMAGFIASLEADSQAQELPVAGKLWTMTDLADSMIFKDVLVSTVVDAHPHYSL